jgi:hypothetical protein
MKTLCVGLLAIFLALNLGRGQALAFFGYGYRANETALVDRCFRGYAWSYAAPFYMIGPEHRNKCIKRYRHKFGLK